MVTTEKSSEGSFASLLDTVTKLATPFAQAFAYGKSEAGDIALQDNRNKYNTLNGSGSNDPRLATSQSPKGLFDFLFGGSGNTPADADKGASGQMIGIAVVIGVIVAAVLWFRK